MKINSIHIRGFGNSGNNLNFSSAARSARKVDLLGAAPVSEETLKAVTDGILTRAKNGDLEAAPFVFELASIQRARAADPGKTATAGR